ncbi:fructosamine kinase family protein [Conexibacter arvalis]|uniref:Fructosamine-3-kinase n=1 Tax=Conexibacter arvalis TaxID=912552 RepID=A0A840IDT4_9ACTN|nr:fructosamine kinase family protein [Conexibacter arvalis]MBB4662956.1 fructosamine-3-kinase [Conexibacter arvalis]
MSGGRRGGGADALAAALATALGRPVAELRPIAGGDLNDAYRATLVDGARVFVKTSADAAPGAYAAEAAGLRWLAEPAALPLPAPLAVADDLAPPPAGPAPGAPDPTAPPAGPASGAPDPTAPPAGPAPGAPDPTAPSPDAAPAERGPRFLVLEWIDSGPAGAATDEALGRGLARLHAAGAPTFGGPADTLAIGPLALPNEPAAGWGAFYADRRLLPLARRADERGALPPGTRAAVDRLAARLHDPADDVAGPPEPPARLHGDLWGGNVMTGADGRPWLIDPAAHGGHREVDLAMLRLFGGPSERTFAAYAEVAPLADGAADRIALWQLAPLLLHAALFGSAYGARCAAALRPYV